MAAGSATGTCRLPVSLIVVTLVAAGFVGFAVGASIESQGPPPTSQPLSIVSFTSSGGFHAWINLTLRSASTTPIGNLTVQLLVSCEACGFAWEPMYLQSPLNITPASPLLNGQTASFGVGTGASAYGPSCGNNYVTITGMYGDTEMEASPFAMVTGVQLACSSP